MSYKSWLKRKENATPYANEANCRRCIHGEWVRTSAFCNGNGRPKKIPYNAWDTDKTSYCPEYIPRKQKIEEAERCYLIASKSVAEKLRGDIDDDSMMVCSWLKGDMCFVVPEEAWNDMIAKSELFVRKNDDKSECSN